jgi:hypothetical protein
MVSFDQNIIMYLNGLFPHSVIIGRLVEIVYKLIRWIRSMTLIRSLISVMIVAAMALPAWTADSYYVSASLGRDRYDGLSPAPAGGNHGPFRTIQKAADAAQRPGDTVIVRDGTYTKPGPDTRRDVVALTHGGSPGAYITFKAENLGGAIIDGGGAGPDDPSWDTAARAGFVLYNGVGYIVIEGFEIKGLREFGIYVAYPDNSYITVRRNHIHHVGNYVSREVPFSGKAGLFNVAGSHDITLDGNKIHDVGRTNLPDTGDHGLYLKGSRNTIINNIFDNFPKGWHIQLAGPKVTDFKIANNTFYGRAGGGDGQIILWDNGGPVEHITISNNISAAARGCFVRVYRNPFNFRDIRYRHNVVSAPALYNHRWGTTEDQGNLLSTDPKLANPPADFHLRPGSPCIGAAYPPDTPDHDYTQVRRAGAAGADVGAYAHISAFPPK